MICDDEFFIFGTPLNLVEAVNTVSLKLLPKKSREKYEYAYKRFMDNRKSKNTSSLKKCCNGLLPRPLFKDEILLANYSMLKSTLLIKHNSDISTYSKLRSSLKRQTQDCRAKKSTILTKEEIEKFIHEAPDEENLMIKVALIFGISGACRMDELIRMTLHDVEDLESKLLISIPDSNQNRLYQKIDIGRSYWYHIHSKKVHESYS